MKRGLALLTLLVMLLPAARLEAASNPVINVNTVGLELCPQSICGAAIFTGFLFGQVGTNPAAIGTFAVAVTHESPLPGPLQTKLITGGLFEFRVGLRRIRGVVAEGTLFNNGDNTFDVDAVLVITSGGSGTLNYHGLLDHNVFPPTVVGPVTQ